MADFNKGDFTQQGVDGHVRATLRLNEKRYVNLDLTTNENARGVTISGKVIDELNNLEYPIGGVNPTGNIAITENTTEGVPLDISQYATATVNVPQGGGSVGCAITIYNDDEESHGGVAGWNQYLQYEEVTLAPNDSVTFIYGALDFDTDVWCASMSIVGGFMKSKTAAGWTNLVNATVYHYESEYYLQITDPTLPSSATLAYSGIPK